MILLGFQFIRFYSLTSGLSLVLLPWDLSGTRSNRLPDSVQLTRFRILCLVQGYG